MKTIGHASYQPYAQTMSRVVPFPICPAVGSFIELFPIGPT